MRSVQISARVSVSVLVAVLVSVPAFAQAQAQAKPLKKPLINLQKSQSKETPPEETLPKNEEVNVVSEPELPRDKISEATQDASAQKVEISRSSKDFRAGQPITIGGNFAPVDMWVPLKIGANVSYNWSPTSSWELEYLKGSISRSVFSIDIGKIEDQRVSLMYRTFSERNSFNFIWGVYYEKFTADLGDEFLSTVSGVSAASVDLLKIETMGVTWGMGNRWHTESGFTFGVDWLTLNIPVSTDSKEGFTQYTTDQGKKDEIKDAIDFLENIPAIGLIKLQAGYSF